MKSRLANLQSYPVEKLQQLFASARPDSRYREINLSIGEPKHGAPDFILSALADNLASICVYPSTQGSAALRQAISAWCGRRYGIAVDAETDVLAVNGTREALFSFAQTMLDRDERGSPLVVCPNPFYQIYEGAARLAGAELRFLNTLPQNDFAFDFTALSAADWARVKLFYVCSPANPTGKVLSLDDWRALFELADRHGFIIASDECYSEIYFDETNPPLGCLQAAHQLGRGRERLMMFSSLSKRSNVPGMRSGFVAGDAALIKRFLTYRTYHGCSMARPSRPHRSPHGATKLTCAKTAAATARNSTP